MADAFQRVLPGQPVRLKGGDWNGAMDAAEWFQRTRAGETGPGPIELALGRPALTVEVLNDSGADVPPFGVLGVFESVRPAAGDGGYEVSRRPVLTGDAPTADGPFVLLVDPVPDGVIGRGVIAGVAVADVDVSDAGHGFAAPIAGDTTKLASAASGPVRLLDPPSGTGVQRLTVEVLSGGPGSGTGAWVIPLEITSAEQPEDCEAESDHGTTCWAKHYFAVIETNDPACDVWADGATPKCVFLKDANGLDLVKGKRYWAQLVGPAPTTVLAALVPEGLPCPSYENAPVYVTDVGWPSYTLVIEEEIASLCPDPDDPLTLRIYKAVAHWWNSCAWVPVGDVLAAEMHGCPLETGREYGGIYNSQILDVDSGLAETGRNCRSLFLIDWKLPVPPGLARMRCQETTWVVYRYRDDGECGYEEYAAGTEGCCDPCGTGGGGGDPGGGGPTDCCGYDFGPIINAVIPGHGTIDLVIQPLVVKTWIGGVDLGCGRTLYIRLLGTGCGVTWSCDRATWTPFTTGITFSTTCSPFLSGPYDTAAVGGTGGGCGPANACTTIDGIMLMEPPL